VSRRIAETWKELRSRPRRLVTIAVVGLLVAVAAVSGGGVTSGEDGPPDQTYLELVRMIDAGQVAEAELREPAETIVVTTVDGDEYVTQLPYRAGAEIVDRLVAAGVDVDVVRDTPRVGLLEVVVRLLPLVILVAVLVLLLRAMRGGVVKSSITKRASVPSVRFDDVAGIDEVRAELSDVVSYLADPGPYVTVGARMPRGMLLCGPPGVGKTLLAKAIAGEAGVPMFAMSGSDFVEVFAGLGSARVRSLFKEARRSAPALIFIDEIDSLGRARGQGGPGDGGTSEAERTLNMLLSEMDGFSSTEHVFVLAATNRAELLDPALLRPGRFDRQVQIGVPDRSARARVLDLYAARHPHRDYDRDRLVARTAGMTGADLANLWNEAAIVAARARRTAITGDDLDTALERIRLGLERRNVLVTDRDRRIVAWHEAGHALVGLLLAGVADPVHVSIIPRGGAGGTTWFDVSDEMLRTRSQLADQLCVMLGGRAAETLLLDGDHTQGAENDLAAATSLATDMVQRWGMSTLGPVRFADGDDAARAEVQAALNDAWDRTVALLETHRAQLERVAAALLAAESLTGDELRALVTAAD
jgi:cell division protease FtsH